MAGRVRHFKERQGRYSARLVVPAKLRPIVGKNELETQLGPDRREALKRLPAAVAALQDRIAAAERQHAQATGRAPSEDRYPLTVEQIATVSYYDRLDQDQRYRNASPAWASAEIDDGYVQQLRDGIAGRLADDQLHELVGNRIQRFQHIGNTTAQIGTPKWRELARAVCISEYEALERIAERDEGTFSGKPSHPMIADAAPEQHTPVPLLDLLDSYLKILERAGKGSGSRQRWTPAFNNLIKFVGHKDAALLTKKNMLEWRDACLENLSAKTVADVYVASVRAVFRWAVENDRLPSNPIDGVKVRKIEADHSREPGFRDNEAVAILKASIAYIPPERDNPANREVPQTTAAKRWVPLLCAFSGARVTEITQLRKQDVRNEDGIWTIRITPEAGSVKTGKYRDVPLHKQVIDLGFLKFLEACGEGPLFSRGGDDLKKAAQSAAKALTKWLHDQKLIPEDLQPNHAWRHRFKTISTEIGISDRVVDAIQGWAARTAGDKYGNITIKARKAAIDKLPRYKLS